MITSIIALSCLLSVSVAANALFIWYIKKLIQMQITYTSGIDEVLETTEERLQDLQSFARKDLILNDPDVQHVVGVIRDAQTDLQDFRDSFSIVSELPDDNIGEETGE